MKRDREQLSPRTNSNVSRKSSRRTGEWTPRSSILPTQPNGTSRDWLGFPGEGTREEHPISSHWRHIGVKNVRSTTPMSSVSRTGGAIREAPNYSSMESPISDKLNELPAVDVQISLEYRSAIAAEPSLRNRFIAEWLKYCCNHWILRTNSFIHGFPWVYQSSARNKSKVGFRREGSSSVLLCRNEAFDNNSLWYLEQV